MISAKKMRKTSFADVIGGTLNCAILVLDVSAKRLNVGRDNDSKCTGFDLFAEALQKIQFLTFEQ